MTYLHVSDFKLGMDRRRNRGSGTAGSLWLGKNVHITRGGDIENAKRFVPTYDLPAGSTFGAAQLKGQLFTFGSANVSAQVPVGVQYQRLQKDVAAMTRVLDAKAVGGGLYVIAEFDDGCIYHFYDGSRVTEWDTIADANASFSVLAAYMAEKISDEAAVDTVPFGTKITITARTAGTAFTISKSTVDNGSDTSQDITLTEVQANVVAVAEVQATALVTITGGTSDPGTNQITQITVDGVNLMTNPVDWATSHTATATALAAEINLLTETHGYIASSDGAEVTLTAEAGTGATPNGDVVNVLKSGNVITTNSDVGGGVTEVEAVAQVYTAEFIGTLETTDKFTITINGTAYSASPRGAATGTSIYINNRRVWSTAAGVWRYSKIADYTAWDPAIHSDSSSGAGFLDVGSFLEVDRILVAAPYNTQSAVFSQDSIGLYTLQADAELNSFDQPIENTGTRAPRSVKTYGNTDVFYLDHSGVRSLRARNGTNTPYVADVGSALDPFIIDYMATLSGGQVKRAVSAIEHTDGRFWLAIGERIFVLSFFPATKISAWTYYEPGFEVSDFVNLDNKVYVRAGDTIYIYGGTTGDQWPLEEDDITEEVQTPFLSAKAPATQKMNYGFDCDATGTWAIAVLPDPNDEDVEIEAGNIHRNTYGTGHIGLPGKAAQWAFNFEHSGGGRAVISSYAIHYQDDEAR
jgi:hypothetical protein